MELKRGQIAINKKALNDFIEVCISFESKLDEIMKEPESFERGKKVAKAVNGLTFARQAFQHFQLNIDLKKLK